MCLWFAWKYPMGVCSNLLMCCVQSLQSCPTLCDPRDCSPQAPLSVGFSRHEYWSGLPCPPPGDLPDSGMEPKSPVCPALQTDALPLSSQGSPQFINRCIFFKKIVFWFFFWLHWVFVAVQGLSLVVESTDDSLVMHRLLVQWLLLLPGTGSVAHQLQQSGTWALGHRLFSRDAWA